MAEGWRTSQNLQAFKAPHLQKTFVTCSALPYSGTMAAASDSSNGVLNGFGTLLGYIGAEAATKASFERLLWPQRSYSFLRPVHLIQRALLLPAGGPLYKASLDALDTAFKGGLFRGRHQGHMLGTSFFPDSDCLFTCHGHAPEQGSYTEAARNNLWMRAMELLDISQTGSVSSDSENNPSVPIPPFRAKFVVRHLTLNVKIDPKKKIRDTFLNVNEGSSTLSLSAIVGVVSEELTGLVVATAVVIWLRSAFAILWVLPLLLKLLSILLPLQREPLDLSLPNMRHEEAQHFEVHIPKGTSTFLVITGPPSLILQFFRHYGHPKRERFREVAQFGVIVAFGFLFPIGLLCSVVWMPLTLQYIWLVYQMYVVVAMYVSRYMRVKDWASTEAGLGRLLTKNEGALPVCIWADQDSGTSVEASLDSAIFSRFDNGQAHVRTLVSKREPSPGAGEKSIAQKE